ncbi:MAG: GNAT family N-acetyltransferase [Dehalococcoidia bacterium]
MQERARTRLQTPRLLLRPFRLTDVDDVLAYAVLEEWSRYLDLVVPYPYARRDAEEFVARRHLEDWSASAHFAIESRGRVIGSIEMRITRDHVANLGYGLRRTNGARGA